MDEAEAVLTHGISGWPTWVRHARREQHWHVPEIIDPDTANASPARTHVHILLVRARYIALALGHDSSRQR